MPSSTVTWTQGLNSGGVYTEYGYSDGTTSQGNNTFGTLTSGSISIFNDNGGTTTIKELYTLYHAFVTDYTSLTIAPPSSPTNITQGNLTGTSIMGTPMSGSGNNPSSSFVSTSTYDRWLWSQDSASARMVPSTTGATSKSALLATDIVAGFSGDAPVISSVTNNDADSRSVIATVNLTSSGSGGSALEYAQTTGTGVPATGWQTGNTFEHPRNTTRYYHASRDRDTANASDTTSGVFVTYKDPATITVANATVAYGFATSYSATITGGIATHEAYTVSDTTGLASANVIANSLDVLNPYTTGAQFVIPNGDLPSAGNNKTYYLYSARFGNSGGDGFFDEVGSFTISQSARDIVPNAYTIPDVTNASLSSEQNAYVQITGINDSSSARRLSGTATFAVSSTTTTPSAGSFNSNVKNISNNQYLHVKQISSQNTNTTLSSEFSVGGVNDTWAVTTSVGGANIEVTTSYAFEPPDIYFIASDPFSTLANPIQITAGQTVQFSFSAEQGVGTATYCSFQSAYWTNTSEFDLNAGQSSTLKEWKSGIAPGTKESVIVHIADAQNTSDTIYFQQPYLTPDTTVSFCTGITVSSAATSHTIDITEVSPDTNSASTRYFVGTTSRLGPGSLTVNSVPTFLGDPTPYTILAALPLGSGGNSSKFTVGTYEVTRGTAPGASPPAIDSYGIAVYDHNEDFITSFTEESTILREVVNGTSLAQTSQCTNIALGVTGVSAGNAIAVITSDGSDSGGATGSTNIAYRFVGGNTLQLGRKTSTSASVDWTVLQYAGNTVGSTPNYGIEIYNQSGQLVIDEFASFYAVKEVLNLATSNSNVTLYPSSDAQAYSLVRVELTENSYPFTGGLPVPALQGPGLATLIPPKVLAYSTAVYSSSYRYVTFYVNAGQFGNGSNWNLAMLTERNSSTPSYYGGSPSSYGIQVNDSSGNILWDSSYRQCIINNIISANQYTSGSSGNFTYDVTTGADGVDPPTALGFVPPGVSDFEPTLRSYGSGVGVSGLNSMDPVNTFVLGGMVTGRVIYRSGNYLDPENSINLIVGGGTHTPGITLTSNSAVTLSMPRLYGGSTPSTGSEYCTRDPLSHHPDGYFVLARIT